MGALFYLENLVMGFIKRHESIVVSALGCILLLFGALIYWPGLSGGFFFDDSINILESPWVQVKDVSLESLLSVWESGVAGPLGRPVSMLSFAINYYFSEFNPFFFKLTNLAIHLFNGLLVYFLLLLFAKASSSGGLFESRMFAVLVAGMWLVHPIQLTSVLYVVQRMTSLAAFFILVALILHVWARQQLGHQWIKWLCFLLAWGVFFPMALLSKESGILFLLYVAVYELVLQRHFRQGFDPFGRCYLGLLVTASFVFILYLVVVPDVGLLRGYDIRNFTLTQRLLTESRVIWDYVRLIVFPVLREFSLYHDDIVVSKGLFDPSSTFVAVAGYFIFLCASWYSRTRFPLFSFGVLWFLIGHSLESTIFPLELMHEHRNYLPSVGVFILFGVFLQSLYRSGSHLKVLASAVAVASFSYASMVTWLRADMYGQDFRRTQIEAEFHLSSVRAQYEAGALLVNMYATQPNPLSVSFAEKYFERVNALDPDYKFALVGQMQLDCLSGGNTRPEVFQELRKRLANAKWMPTDRAVMHGIAEMANAGTICLDRSQVDDLFDVAVNNKTVTVEDRSVVFSDYVLYLWLGQKDYAATQVVLLAAINGNKSDILNRINLLQLSRSLGDKDTVIALLNDLEGKRLNRQDRKLVQSVIDELKSNGVVYSPKS